MDGRYPEEGPGHQSYPFKQFPSTSVIQFQIRWRRDLAMRLQDTVGAQENPVAKSSRGARFHE